ncbi:hypothetical protein PR048_026027 [Dryococelus australis]|uniref:Uncharacterized protein n=1 Tax=Dryococelus australis TaxID=614101 RepID=A0ABQ9GK85_9NEOP|nr:hypothetical protein PR048_026027 [Dryococelus australis]
MESTFEAVKCVSNKVDRATRVKCVIAATHKGFKLVPHLVHVAGGGLQEAVNDGRTRPSPLILGPLPDDKRRHSQCYRSDYLPPTKANRVGFPTAVVPQDFRMRISSRRCRLSAGFPGGSPVSSRHRIPALLHTHPLPSTPLHAPLFGRLTLTSSPFPAAPAIIPFPSMPLVENGPRRYLWHAVLSSSTGRRSLVRWSGMESSRRRTFILRQAGPQWLDGVLLIKDTMARWQLAVQLAPHVLDTEHVRAATRQWRGRASASSRSAEAKSLITTLFDNCPGLRKMKYALVPLGPSMFPRNTPRVDRLSPGRSAVRGGSVPLDGEIGAVTFASQFSPQDEAARVSPNTTHSHKKKNPRCSTLLWLAGATADRAVAVGWTPPCVRGQAARERNELSTDVRSLVCKPLGWETDERMTDGRTDDGRTRRAVVNSALHGDTITTRLPFRSAEAAATSGAFCRRASELRAQVARLPGPGQGQQQQRVYNMLSCRLIVHGVWSAMETQSEGEIRNAGNKFSPQFIASRFSTCVSRCGGFHARLLPHLIYT